MTLISWDLWREDVASRIVAVPGDLRQPRLGLDDVTYEDLCRKVDSIFHCATSMNHLETYAMARAANVESSKELLRLATCHKVKLVNFISTLGVFNASSDGTTRVVDEATPIDQEKHSIASGYSASKWVGEKIFLTALNRGIPCNIFRLGLVWADSAQGRYDELQREYRVLKSCLLSGYGIENYRYRMTPTPVDYVGRAIAHLGNRHLQGGRIFHICSPTQSLEGIFEACNNVAETSLELVSHYEWIAEMKKLHLSGQSMPVTPLIEFAFSMDEESFAHLQSARASRSIRIDATFTRQELESAGIVAPIVGEDLLRLCVESMFARDLELRGLAECSGNPVMSRRNEGLRAG